MLNRPQVVANLGAVRANYRPDIDGLRAVAVVAVVMFHAFPSLLPGGFLGVDVFFVISGFLITGVIASRMDVGEFSLLDFYGRRIRRIFPALIIVLLFTAAAGFALAWTTEMQQLGWHLFGASLFLPNIFLWNESGYFDAAAQTKPLLHLWSLGVEEQFYIVWPALLFLALMAKCPLKVILFAVTVTSFVYSWHLSSIDATAAFYSPFSRAWELAFGGLLSRSNFSQTNALIRSVVVILGLVAIGMSFVFIHELSFSVWYAAIPVVGTGLVIVAGPDNAVAKRSLNLPPFVLIGLISYPLYLWHWPLLTFARMVQTQLSISLVVGILCLSVVFAFLTYCALERPLQRRAPPRAASTYLVALMILIGGVGYTTSRFDIRNLLYPADVQAILAYTRYDYISDARVGKCWLRIDKPDQKFSDECGFAPGWTGRKIAIWGDSHSGRLYPGLKLVAPNNVGIAEYVGNSCPPIETYTDGYCAAVNQQTLADLIREKPETAILFGRWTAYSDNYASGKFTDGLNSFIDKLEANGIKVMIIGPFPSFPDILPKVIFEQWAADKEKPIPTRIPSLPDERTVTVNTQLKALADKRHIQYFSLIDLLCNARGCSSTSTSDPADLISWDYGHLTTGGGRYVGAALLKSLSLE